LEKIHHALYVRCREQADRAASPTACVIDSQSVKSAEKRGAGIDPHVFDAGKLTKGKKRHVLVDTLGLVLHALVTATDVQDRDGGILLPPGVCPLTPQVRPCTASARKPDSSQPDSEKALLILHDVSGRTQATAQ
jgi:hypothetical protein